MTEREIAGLAVLAVLLALVAGCADTPRVSRQVNRAVLGGGRTGHFPDF